MLKYFVCLCFLLNVAIAQPPPCVTLSISQGISQDQLMTNVLNMHLTAIFGVSTPTEPFFNGSVPAGSVNFVTNSTAYGILFNGFLTYFGRSLGCDAIQPYMGNENLQQVHAAMPITNNVFNFFNQQVIQALANNGFTQFDREEFFNFLESTRGDVCNQPDCTIGATTQAVTSNAITSSAISSSAITSSAITSNAVTSSAITSAYEITSSAITSSAITSSDITSNAITSSEITSNAITSSAITSNEMTTSQVTSSRITSSAVTSSRVPVLTSGRITTSRITSARIMTSSRVTSARLLTSDSPFVSFASVLAPIGSLLIAAFIF